MGKVVEGRVALPKGTVLDGSYRIERVIGSGGFGITYQAGDVKLGTTVAIKEYYPGDFGRRDDSLSVRPTSEKQKPTFEWGRSSFLEEARTLARFRHPSVVQVTRVFEAYSTAYMVMIFEQGQSFEARLRGLGRSPTQEELDQVAGPLLDALEMMHSQSFLHRDIAPDNIIIRVDGTPVLLDFGAARRAVAEMSRALTGIVKVGYSPPEQYAADGRLQGPWSDLYALGATFYRAVTGKAPEESTLRREDDRTPAAGHAAPSGLYRSDFLAAIDACLRVERTKRPQSVAQLRPMLLAKERSSANSATRREPSAAAPPAVAARPNRRPWVIAAVAVLVVLGGTFGGIYYTHWSGQEGLQSAPPKADQGADSAWAAVKDSTSTPALEAFIKRFPDSFFSDLARVRIGELKQLQAEEVERAGAARKRAEAEARRREEERVAAAEEQLRARVEADEAAAWAAVKDTKNIPAFEAFVARYPKNFYADLARQRIAELRKREETRVVTPQPAPKTKGSKIDVQVQAIEISQLGLSVVNGIGPNKDDVVITEVDPDADAARKGLKSGDIIMEMGGTGVKTQQEVANAVREAIALGRKAVLIRLKSGEQQRFVAVQLKMPTGR